MDEVFELVLSSEENAETSNIFAWNHHTGSVLKTYRSANHATRTLCFAKDYIFSAQTNQPFIHVWATHGNGHVDTKMVTPGRVSAMCVTPDGSLCMAGIDKRLHLWDVSTGNLLAVISHHFEKITCIRCTSGGTYFVSGAEDSLALVWNLSSLVSEDVEFVDGRSSNVTPLHTWSHHSASVTDIYVTRDLLCQDARVATCSMDQTCKFYEIVSGQLLLNIVFPDNLSAVILDPMERHLIVAGVKGKMYLVKMYTPSKLLDYHFSSEEKPRTFEGHSKRITSLDVSEDGSTLCSGSLDATVRLWHLGSGQCTRIFNHKGPVTNVIFVHECEYFFYDDPASRIMLEKFKRTLYADSITDKLNIPDICIKLIDRNNEPRVSSSAAAMLKRNQVQRDDDSFDSVSAKKLCKINRECYDFSVQQILQEQ